MTISSLEKKLSFQILWHFFLFTLGIGLAFVIAKTGVAEILIAATGSHVLLTSFVAGIFFTSLVTVAPAGVVFFELGQTDTSLLLISLFGGIGAMVGDLGLFKLVSFTITDDLIAHFQRKSHGYFRKLMHLKLFSFTMVFIGALIVASPLPDELGLAMMSVAEIDPRVIMGISFIFNVIGIGVVVLAGQAIM